MATSGREFRLKMAVGFAALLLLAGCSELPNEPPTSNTGPDGGAVSSPATDAQSTDLLGGLRSQTSATTSKVLVGLVGGVVAAGDFTVVVPPGAITGTATVTVTQPNLSHGMVELDISPASANRFNTPVVLVANARRMDRSLLSSAYISWYNPSTGKWERVRGSTVNLADLTVAAPLWHFSKYRVDSGGKAGW